MKYLIFNLKSKLDYDEIIEYERAIQNYKENIIISPSYLYLSYFENKGYITCAQNVSNYDSGNYTGEVSAKQLKSIDTKYVLIGHYERKIYAQETEIDYINKIKQSLNNKLKVIFCIGDETKDNDVLSIEFLKKEIDQIFTNFDKEDLQDIILAYEPIYNIATNSFIDVEKINKIISMIRTYVLNKYEVNIEIVYGGSVNKVNLDNLKKLTVDGYLIGEASTHIDEIFTLLDNLIQ